jgi:hypothetical protein
MRRQPNFNVETQQREMVASHFSTVVMKNSGLFVAKLFGIEKFHLDMRDLGVSYSIVGSAARRFCTTMFGDSSDINKKFIPEDIDIYFSDEQSLKKATDYLNANTEKHSLHWSFSCLTTDFGQTKAQIAVDPFWHIEPWLLMEHFDFTVCMFALQVDGRTVSAIYNPTAMIDAIDGRLVIHSLPNPTASCYRAVKMMARGHTMSAEESAKLAAAVKRERNAKAGVS